MKKRDAGEKREEPRGEAGLGGILAGLSALVGKLGEIAQTGETLCSSGGFGVPGKGIEGIYGFTVRVGPGNRKPQVQPFGNIRSDPQRGQAVVHETREPAVDVMEETDHVLIVAEMPGVGAPDVNLELRDDILVLSAARGEKKYYREIVLPGSFSRDQLSVTCRNGVVEIRCNRPRPDASEAGDKPSR